MVNTTREERRHDAEQGLEKARRYRAKLNRAGSTRVREIDIETRKNVICD